MTSASNQGIKSILENKSKFLLLHCSSGHKTSSLTEILASDPSIQSRLSDTKYYQESKVLNQFYKTLSDDDGKGFYGLKWVKKCVERQGVESLLISDTLFR